MSAFFLEQKPIICYYIIYIYDREVCILGRAFADDETVF